VISLHQSAMTALTAWIVVLSALMMYLLVAG
jgi:hypothetical protein